jgi:pyruvate/2-oxoglutarate dehydrogenase complex dihydrolipoamide dehydrogenase (E3) component
MPAMSDSQVQEFDALIIGGGQAGPSLAGRLAGAGMKVAIVERNLFGGTCVNTGCIPTKALIASAEVAHQARRAAQFGITTGEVRVDMSRIKQRVLGISSDIREGLVGWLENMPGCTVIRGHARFEAADKVRVGNELLVAPKIFINVGARAVVPDFPGVDQVRYLTNSSILQLDRVPEHLVIIGGSYVGLEFAQMYRRFGAKVTVVEKSARLASREDEDVSAELRAIVEAEGVVVRTDAECIRFEKHAAGVATHVNCSAGDPMIVGTDVLLAVGRRPNTDDLGLERAGVVIDKRGYITVDDGLATNVPGIWALGECNGHGAFTHTAYNDYEILAANLLDGENRRLSQRIVGYALFVDPPLGRVGLTDAEARKSGRNLLAAKLPMTKVKRAIIKGQPHGFMKVVVDAESRKILGAAVLGPGGDEVIYGLLDMMNAEVPCDVLIRSTPIHPTVGEFLPTLLGGLKPM